MKRVFIVGVEGPGSGSFDWLPKKDSAERFYATNVQTFKDLPGEIIYRGELDVPADLEGEALTEHIHNFLMEHGFEAAPLINKEIYNKRDTFQSPYEQYREQVGKKFELLGAYTGNDPECGNMYRIKLETGEEITAWPEEIFTNVSSFA